MARAVDRITDADLHEMLDVHEPGDGYNVIVSNAITLVFDFFDL